MEAYVNGIKIVGTPETIAEVINNLEKLQADKNNDQGHRIPIPNSKEQNYWANDWLGIAHSTDSEDFWSQDWPGKDSK